MDSSPKKALVSLLVNFLSFFFLLIIFKNMVVIILVYVIFVLYLTLHEHVPP